MASIKSIPGVNGLQLSVGVELSVVAANPFLSTSVLV